MQYKKNVILIEVDRWPSKTKPSYETIQGQYPIGLGYLSAALKSENISCEILDLNYENMTDNEYIDYIKIRNPSLIGISSFTINYRNAVRIAILTKKALKNVPVVYGGIHASTSPIDILNDCRAIDYILTGECEHTISNFYHAILSGTKTEEIEGVISRKNFKDINSNNNYYPLDLNSLPHPDYDSSFTSLDKYYKFYGSNINAMTMITTRGCPHKCPYCSTSGFHGQKYRMRSVDSVMNEINYLTNKYNIGHIAFADDSFATNKKRLLSICNRISTEHHGVSWGCSCRLDDLNQDTLKIMSDSGCKNIFIGVETLSDKLQELIGKRNSIATLDEIITKSSESGIKLTLAFMIGFPGETHKDRMSIKKMIKKYVHLVPDWRFAPLTVYPGTPFWEENEKYGIDINENNKLYPNETGRSYIQETEWSSLLEDLVALRAGLGSLDR